MPQFMNILITSASAPLAQSLADALRTDHTVRLTERVPTPKLTDFAVSTLGHDLSTNLLVRGMDAIVHVAEPLPSDNDLQQLDYLTRCTYNLCLAAVAEGVRRLVYLSTLDLMTAYDPTFAVSERWRPRPSAEAPVLAKHLGEFVCREFAREHKLDVTVLRLGKVVRSEEVAGAPYDPLWVEMGDVTQAVKQALLADSGRWTVLHIQHEGPQARFSVASAKRVLGFEPAVNFM
jgi:nucleoside-diphosphate-sugar epimerase